VSPTPVAVKASTPPQSVSPLALVYMAMMLGSWLGGAYLLQGLQTATGAASTFQRPFFLTWVTQVAFSGMLVLQKLRTRGEGSVAAADDRPLTTEERVGRLLLVPRRVVRQVRLGRLVTLSSILLLYRWLWTLSLQETAVSLNTALFNSHVFMVFLLSAIFLNERVTAVKLLAVVCGSLGVLYMTGLKGVLGALLPFGARAAGAGASIGSCSLRGCLLTILSAVAYSVYAIAYKQWVPAELTLDVVAGQGTTALTALPLFPLLHATSVERLALPPIPSLMPLAALAVGGLAYYLFYSLALSQASPLFVAIGQMLILPVAALIDTCVKDVRPSSDELIGAGLILLAFGGLAGGGRGRGRRVTVFGM